MPNHYSEQTVLNLVNIKHNKISKFLLRVVIWHIYLCCIEVSDKKLPLKPVMMENISWNRRFNLISHPTSKGIWPHCVLFTEKYIVLMLRQISQSCGKNSFVLVACQNITARKNSWNYCSARDCDNRTTLVKQKFQPNSFSMYAM